MQTLTRGFRYGAVTVIMVVAALVTTGAQGRLSGPGTLKLEEIPWPSASAGGAGTSGASGIETVVLKGDPTKPGLYVLALRAGPNMTIQAHSHKDDRVATVLKGTWYFGYGQAFDEKALKALPPGSSYTEPPNTAHFARTREQVVLEIVGYGPTSTTYVNPADDPTKK
ncbi:MAG TPA: cupin domain-containing protein [Vicinamibacterales bacterium]|nr:cupin domain-containing protein [Vicinamibacterales bacterium]